MAMRQGDTSLFPRLACEEWWKLQPEEGPSGTSLRLFTVSVTTFKQDYYWCKAFKESGWISSILFLERCWVVDGQWPTLYRLLKQGVEAYYEVRVLYIFYFLCSCC